MNKLINKIARKITKSIFASGDLFPVINKYLPKVKKVIFDNVKDDKLMHNLYLRLNVNRHDIKNEFAKDLYCHIEISSPDIKKSDVISVGINCSSPSYASMDYPDAFEAYCNTDDKFVIIHLGVQKENFESLYNDFYQDNLQHQMIHAFQLSYGYINKLQNNDNIDVNDYENSFNITNQDSETYDINNEFDWRGKVYYADVTQFNTYLTNLISVLKKIYNAGKDKKYLEQILVKTNFKNHVEVKKLIGEIRQKKIMISYSIFVWLYHLANNNKDLFNKAIKTALRKINEF